MTPDDLRQWLAIYGPGLDAEVALLHQLKRLSMAQREATAVSDAKQLAAVALERDRIMAALVKIEHELRPAREALANHREMAAGISGFADIAALHRMAADLVAEIVHSDQDTIRALQDAEVARRLAAQTMGTAGSTLAAYRRVVAPPLMGAGLVDRRG
jgi:hypothetical protein